MKTCACQCGYVETPAHRLLDTRTTPGRCPRCGAGQLVEGEEKSFFEKIGSVGNMALGAAGALLLSKLLAGKTPPPESSATKERNELLPFAKICGERGAPGFNRNPIESYAYYAAGAAMGLEVLAKHRDAVARRLSPEQLKIARARYREILEEFL